MALTVIYLSGDAHPNGRDWSVTLQIVRDWVLKFNGACRDYRERPDSGGPWDCARAVADLCQWDFEEFRVAVRKQKLSRLARLGVIASYRPGLAITFRPQTRSKILKKVSRAPGSDRRETDVSPAS